MEGWIKLHRKMLDWEWFTDSKTLSVFLYLLISANHVQKKWRGVTIDKGQLVTSNAHICTATGLTRQQVRTALDHLKLTREVTIQSTKLYSIVTITNYESYQAYDGEEQPTEQPDNNQEITKNQPSINQPPTITKNNKNEKNERMKEGDIIEPQKRFRKPTYEEVEQYCRERNNGIDAHSFVDYYESKDWKIGKTKMKDWKAAIRTWESKRKETQPKTEPNLFRPDMSEADKRQFQQKVERDNEDYNNFMAQYFKK